MPYHIDEENSELVFEVREGNKLVIKLKSNTGGGGSDIYLIKVGDETTPTEKNTFSALRILKEIEQLHETILQEVGSDLSVWEIKQAENGEKYISTKYDVVTEKGITAYSSGRKDTGSIVDGIPFDNKTIWFNPETGVVEVIGGTGGGSFDSSKMWELLLSDTDEQINISHLADALSGYATEDELRKKWTQDDNKISNWDTAFSWGDHSKAGYAHLANEETFSDIKHFTQGLTVGEGKHKLYEKDGVVYLDGDLAVTGGLTAYALGDTDISTIMDGVVVDGTTIKKENGQLVAVGGSGSSFDKSAMWTSLSEDTTEQINISHLTNALSGYAVKSDTLAGYGITDAYTKTEADNRYVNVSGDTMTGTLNLIGKVSVVFDNPSIRFYQDSCRIGTDTGGTLGIFAENKIVLRPNSKSSNSGKGVDIYDSRVTYNGYDIWHAGNDGSGSGLDADLLDSKHLVNITNKLLYNAIPYINTDGVIELGKYIDFHSDSSAKNDYDIRLQCPDNVSLKIINLPSINGTLALLSDNVASATKLYTPRTLWGRSFDGTANVSGDMTGVGNVTFSGNLKGYNSTSGGYIIYSGYKSGESFRLECLNSSGDWIHNGMVMLQNGYIGIGTLTPSTNLHVVGNILSTGGITCHTSDARAKTIIEELSLSLKQISESPIIRFKWNGWNIEYDGKTHLGGIAQYVQKILPECVLNTENMLHMDYATTAYIYSVQTARHLQTYETRTDIKIKKLEKEIKILKKQLKKLGYEESNTLVN